MKKYLALVLSVVLALGIIVGCEEDEPTGPSTTPETASALYVMHYTSATIAMIDLETGTVYPDRVTQGTWAAQISYYNGKVYVVNTGDNNIDIIDPDTWEKETPVDLGQGQYPQKLVFTDDNTAWVACSLSGKVLKVDMANKTVLAEITAGVGCTGVAANDEYVYGINSGYSYPDYNAGSVTVISIATGEVVTTIDVGVNAQAGEFDADGMLHVVCTGAYDGTGSASIIDPSTNTVVETVSTGGSPGSITISETNGAVYMGCWGAGVVAYDVDTYDVLNDADDMILGYGGSAIIAGPQGELFVADDGSQQVHELDAEGNIVVSYDVSGGPNGLALKTVQ